MTRIESFAPEPVASMPSPATDAATRAAVMLEHPRLAVAVTEQGRITETNAAWQALFALPDRVVIESQVALLFADGKSVDRFERLLQSLLATMDGGAPSASAEHVLVRRDGSTFMAEIVVWLHDAADIDHAMTADAIWQVRDVSAHHALDRELRELEDYHHELARHQWDLTFVIDRKGRISYASPSVERMLGHRVHALLGEAFTTLLAPGQAAAAGQWLRRTAAKRHRDPGDEGVDGYPLHVLDREGRERVLAGRARNCFDVPRIAGMIVHAREGTGTVEAMPVEPATAVDETPSVDAATGLPDRAAAWAWLERRVGEVPTDTSLTILSIDLDRLQDVNDRHGHAVGDAVVARTARALATAIGAGGYVARVGGDAFVVVLANAATKAVDETVAMLLARILETADGLPSVAASIGVARLPDDAEDAAALWLHGELAMREAKKRGRGQAFFFTPRLAASNRVQRALEGEIRDALARDEFVLFYQPQIALASGRVVGLEALLRWQHPTRGLLLPDVFIDTAVERGLIEAITKSVLHQVCERIAAWRRAGAFADLPVGVNVAATQFHDRRLPALVASALLRSGLPARLLVLELAEQSLVSDDPETERVVKELDRLGVRTAVGGFALGHGAVRQLRQLHVAQIKLDRGFVADLPRDEAGAVVIGAMIALAQRLKCQVVAEGVETREQFEQLRILGCEIGQGFYFGAPLSADEIQAFVEQNAAHPIQ